MFFTVLCCVCLDPVFLSAPGRGGEGHEGEDAQERGEVVVLLAKQKQQHQISKFTDSLKRLSSAIEESDKEEMRFSLVGFCF